MPRPKLSPRLQAERSFVEAKLSGKVICDRCGVTLETYASHCPADLSDSCPGFMKIEATKADFAMQVASGVKPV